MAMTDTPMQTRVAVVTPWRDRVATALMLLLALSALYACASGIGAVTAAGPQTVIVEAWRTIGYAVFAGLFALLAFYPRALPGLWELAILDKAGIALFSATQIARGASGAQADLIADGALAVLLIISYMLTRGYTNWLRLRNAQR